MSKSTDIFAELEGIANAGGGIVKPEKVVEFAKDPATALHSRFEWDDQKAGDRYRLWQARQIIKVHVTVQPDTDVEHSVFVALEDDLPDGGYRFFADVMSDEEMRIKLLAQARKEFEAWQKKYIAVKDLTPVFEAMEATKAKQKVTKKSKRGTPALKAQVTVA